MFSDDEVERIITQANRIFVTGDKPQWVVKFQGQPVKLYNGRETFSSEGSAKRSLSNYLKYRGSLVDIVREIRQDPSIGGWNLSREYNPELAKRFLERGILVIERIR